MQCEDQNDTVKILNGDSGVGHDKKKRKTTKRSRHLTSTEEQPGEYLRQPSSHSHGEQSAMPLENMIGSVEKLADIHKGLSTHPTQKNHDKKDIRKLALQLAITKSNEVKTNKVLHHDYVLVYKTGDNSNVREKLRKKYESELHDQGFRLDRKYTADKTFVVLHCSFERLCEEAEKVSLEMPLEGYVVGETSNNSLWKRFRDHFKTDDEVDFVSAPFCVSKSHLYEGINNPDTFFRPALRSLLVHHILTDIDIRDKESRQLGQNAQGLGYVLLEGAYIDAFILHERSLYDAQFPLNDNGDDSSFPHGQDIADPRKALHDTWLKHFRYQPLWKIRNYFGEKIALYFGWLGLLTSSLIIPMLLGLAVFLWGLVFGIKDNPLNEERNSTSSSITLWAKNSFDNEVTPFFALIICLWAISGKPEMTVQARRALRELNQKEELEGSSVPAEIRARGPRAERAFQKALQTSKVKVYRGRIILLGQERAGKTSVKKSLLGLPFDPNQESTVGVEVDRSRCEIEVDEVVNWMLSKRKKRKVSEFEEEMARFIARYLTESEADDDSSAIHPNVEELKRTDQLEEAHDEPTLLPDVNEPATGAEETRDIAEDSKKAGFEEKLVDKDEVSDVHHLDISSTTLRNNVTAQVMRHLQSPRLEDDIKSEEAILTLWDFAGQHLYYASHPVFLSGRAVYILVHNLNKNLLATAEPLVRQGMNEILLDNPNNETNLDNLLSWLVSVHNIRSNANTNVAHRGTKQSYLRPPVFIVGTNLDQPFEDVKTAENRIKKSVLGKDYAKHVIMPFFIVNNKAENDEGVQKLRHKIMEVLKDEPYMPEEVPLRWFNFERAVDALVAKQIYFMDLNKLLSIIRQVCHVDDEEEVKAMLNFYHDLGVIVKHGRTVVLQAQWLIDLFKQLITVRPHDEADPLYVNCWRELEVNGILRMALVDHVFSKFSKKGLRKQDILDMMELYGLIAKFSNGTDENQDEQSYFVPTQLRSSPSALCEIKPSEYDPCPLVLHFLDGFVPHGLFPRLVSEFIHWCSENGFRNTPQLFNNGARLFIGKQILFDLILICKKRFIKIVLKRRNTSSSKPLLMSDSNEMAFEVRNFVERTLHGFSRDLCWLSNLQYELSVVCTHCLQSRCSLHKPMSCCQDDCLHLLRVRPGEELICEKNFHDETVSPGWEMWFEVPHTQTKESNKDTSEAVGLEESVSFKPGTLSEDDVLLIAHELGASWKKLALVLKVPYAGINEIKEDETKVFERSHAVLTCWQERFPNDATYHRLARALQHPVVGRVDLAVKYCGLQFGKDVSVAKDY